MSRRKPTFPEPLGKLEYRHPALGAECLLCHLPVGVSPLPKKASGRDFDIREKDFAEMCASPVA